MTFPRLVAGRGFTLIELLVVVAIIGLLGSIVLTSLASSRQKARDARRAQEIHSVQNALEDYFTANHAYPTIRNVSCSSLKGSLAPDTLSNLVTCSGAGLSTYYTSAAAPHDPLCTAGTCQPGQADYQYAYELDSNGNVKGYGIKIQFEVFTPIGSASTICRVGADTAFPAAWSSYPNCW